MTDIPPYIVPIGCYENAEPKFCGTGFIVGDYLITAYHVIKDKFVSGAFAFINDKCFKIGVSNHWYLYEDMRYDYAVISLKGRDVFNIGKNDKDFVVDSPLQLSVDVPQVGCRVSNMYYKRNSSHLEYFEEDDNEVCKFPYELPESEVSWEASFVIKHSGQITHGASGSPVLVGNKVVGIITQGFKERVVIKRNLPLDYLNYCECLPVNVLQSKYPELFE